MRKDGSEFPAEASIAKAGQEGSERLFIILRDISDRVKAEQELQETQGRLQAFAEHSRDMIYLVRLQPNRRYEYVSPASTEIYGYTPEEFYADSKLLLKGVKHGYRNRS